MAAKQVPDTMQDPLRGFVAETVTKGATVYTDEHKSYMGIPNPHQTVKHSSPICGWSCPHQRH